MFQHKLLLVSFLISITLVGLAAGMRVAQIKNEDEIARNATSTKDIHYSPEVLVTDKTFFQEIFDGAAKLLTKTESKDTPAKTQPVKVDPVKAEAYLVGDIMSGEIYMQKNATKVYPFASMSKLITALVAKDIYSATTTIKISEANANVPKDASGLRAGEEFTLSEIMYPMLLNSSNVAAEAVGSSTDRAAFLELMAGYSWEIGMPESYFADPTGLSERNAGTAKGFFAMAQYLYKNRPEILALTKTATSTLATTTEHDAHVFVSTHPFVNDPRFLGGKTGRTDAALETMLTIMQIGEKTVAIIVLRSPYTRAADTKYLVDKIGSMLAATN